jgi:hypothetical protein
MSIKLPLSAICLEACMKRGSSRSIGGIDAIPGRNAARQSRISSA